jgi:hypothetical protein
MRKPAKKKLKNLTTLHGKSADVAASEAEVGVWALRKHAQRTGIELSGESERRPGRIFGKRIIPKGTLLDHVRRHHSTYLDDTDHAFVLRSAINSIVKGSGEALGVQDDSLRTGIARLAKAKKISIVDVHPLESLPEGSGFDEIYDQFERKFRLIRPQATDHDEMKIYNMIFLGARNTMIAYMLTTAHVGMIVLYGPLVAFQMVLQLFAGEVTKGEQQLPENGRMYLGTFFDPVIVPKEFSGPVQAWNEMSERKRISAPYLFPKEDLER